MQPSKKRSEKIHAEASEIGKRWPFISHGAGVWRAFEPDYRR